MIEQDGFLLMVGKCGSALRTIFYCCIVLPYSHLQEQEEIPLQKFSLGILMDKRVGNYTRPFKGFPPPPLQC